jgi:FAD/FMN-containing dehydrogenase
MQFPSFNTSSFSGSSYNPGYSQSFPGTSSLLNLNTNPDPPSHTIVTFGAGVRSKQLDSATAASPYGAFHVPTSAFPVGAGQFVLGGFGFLGRKHGLAMYNVVEAEMVLADGRVVWVGQDGKHAGEWRDDEDPNEVWWGIRGAGPALGIITRFRAKAYYIPSVYAGNLI